MNEPSEAAMPQKGSSIGGMSKVSNQPQPIDLFFEELKKHQANMIDNHHSFANLLGRLDSIANRLAPNSYYQNIPIPVSDETNAKQSISFEFEHGGIYSGLNEVMVDNRTQERDLQLQIDALRRKVSFLEQFI